jgi:predicted MPP superfamily phosphohydrolase
MRLIAIPDIHGSTHWKKVLKGNYDRIVFLGDYVDSWVNKWPEQMDNLLEIIQFKKDNPDKVKLLWGNHDTSYLLDERCSGFQPEHAIDLHEVFANNKNLFEVIYTYQNYLFAHGGVSSKWMKCAGIKKVEEINDLFHMFPNYFRWVGPDGYGNNLNEGPLWIRPRSLGQVAVKGYIQVVGHTEMGDVTYFNSINGKEQIIGVDTREHNRLLELEIK